VENWKPCPANVDGYTHIFIAFATSYNTACQITAPPICSGASSTQVADWQETGIKVVISYGGWNMNSYWQDCFGKEDQASTDLVNIVSSQDFDGVNIDFESQVDSSAQNFLKEMNVYLRDKMDALSTGKKYELSHVPMDVDMAEGKPYFNILASQKDIIDYVMPQVSAYGMISSFVLYPLL
jgi:chitinase